MRSSISYAALAVALAASATAVHAQTVIPVQPVETVMPAQPVETVITQPPAQTVQTTETMQTIQPSPRSPRHQVVTTKRTVTTTTPAQVATIAANPQPVYDQVPRYDTAAPPATLDETVLAAQPEATVNPAYRYVYEDDRILVVDPSTGLAVQALPR